VGSEHPCLKHSLGKALGGPNLPPQAWENRLNSALVGAERAIIGVFHFLSVRTPRHFEIWLVPQNTTTLATTGGSQASRSLKSCFSALGPFLARLKSSFSLLSGCERFSFRADTFKVDVPFFDLAAQRLGL
jgi:hypothetical protein